MPSSWAVFFFSSIEGKTLYTREYYTHEYIKKKTYLLIMFYKLLKTIL